MYLIQLAGSFAQSVLHLNLSQVSHPMGGVSPSPLSNAKVLNGVDNSNNNRTGDISELPTTTVGENVLQCSGFKPRWEKGERNLFFGQTAGGKEVSDKYNAICL